MDFADQLKSERKRLRLTQAEAAEQILEVSFECLSKWERRLTTPPAITQEGALERLRRAKPAKK